MHRLAQIPMTRILKADQPSFGCWLSLASPSVAEVLGHVGFSWLLIDQQHSPVGPELLVEMVRAVNVSGTSPVVRVARNEPQLFDQALDAGAHGVMVPMVSDEESAWQAVRRSTYPPAGQRSIGGYRAQFSFGMARDTYLADASNFIEVWVQIEDRTAVENAEAIAKVPGVTGLFIGPQDLAASLGLTPTLEPASREFDDALDHLLAATARSGCPLGILVPDLASARHRADQGFRIIAVGSDARILTTGGADLIAGL